MVRTQFLLMGLALIALAVIVALWPLAIDGTQCGNVWWGTDLNDYMGQPATECTDARSARGWPVMALSFLGAGLCLYSRTRRTD